MAVRPGPPEGLSACRTSLRDKDFHLTLEMMDQVGPGVPAGLALLAAGGSTH
jgi:hypothetical protein